MPDKVELPKSINESFNKFLLSKTTSDFESFLNDFRTSSPSFDSEQESYFYEKTSQLLKSTLLPLDGNKCIFPESKNDEKLTESLNYPVYGLFKVLYQYEDKCKKCILDLLVSLHEQLPNLGYLLLYFLKVYAKLQSRAKQNASLVFKINVYKLYCQCNSLKLEESLANDLNLLEKFNTSIFLWLLPDIYREFKCTMINNSDIIKILVSCVDAKNLRDLIYNVTQGKLVILKNDGIIDVLRQSLNYETFEQLCVWQIVQAHDVPIASIQVNN